MQDNVTMNGSVPIDAEPRWNRDEAERFLRILHRDGDTYEIRVLNSRERGWKGTGNWIGYFKNAKVAADTLDEFWQTHEGGHAYLTINPVYGMLHDRAPDQFRLSSKSTKDADIAKRRWLYLDFDPVRAADTSATADEKAKAHAVAMGVKAWLAKQGWPEPMVVDSGNGYHLYYRCDLEAKDDLPQMLLRVLGAKFGMRKNGDPVDVDQCVYNASRIAKIPGTASRKGESTTERPHRGSQILCAPDIIAPVPEDKISLVACITNSPRVMVKRNAPPAMARTGSSNGKKILSALGAIDPRKLDYNGWRDIGMALKSWDDKEGLEAWHEWSAKDSDRYDPKTLDAKWPTFAADRDDKVTLGTLFHMAEEAGWSKYAFLFPMEPPPALVETIEEPAFPGESLPPELVEYADDIAEEFGYESGPVAASMLAVASVLACDKWAVEVKPGWMEPLVIWLVKVASSGEKKTPEFRALIGPIEKDLERRAADHDSKMQDYRAKKRIVEKRAATILNAKSLSLEDAKEQLRALDDELGQQPHDPHYMVSNMTTQAVEVMAGRAANKAGIAKVAIMSDEGGQFINAVTGFHSEGRTANEFILKGYDLSADCRVRVGDGSGRVKFPAIPVLTYIQPRRLWAALQSHGEELQDQGLIPRCLMLKVNRTPTGWREGSIDAGKRMAYEAIMEPLALTEPLTGNDDGVMPLRALVLSPEAKAVMADHYTWADHHAPMTGPMQSWWNKFAGRTARIAGLLHLTAGQNETSPISGDMMVRAVRLANWFAAKNEQAMMEIRTESREGLLARIIRHIIEKDAKTFTARDTLIWTRGCLEVESMEDIRPALLRLEDLGYIARLDDRWGKGRPSERYAANPTLFSGGAANEPTTRKLELSPAGDRTIGPWPERPGKTASATHAKADKLAWAAGGKDEAETEAKWIW